MEQDSGSLDPIVLSAEAFLERLGDEIARSDRYEHPFTVVTLRPLSRVSELGARARWLESAAGLTRGCDVVAVLDEGPMLMVMLPETDVSGGALVLERLRNAIDDSGREWEYGLLQYPENRSRLLGLMKDAA